MDDEDDKPQTGRSVLAVVDELEDEELAMMLENLETVDEGGPARAVEFEGEAAG